MTRPKKIDLKQTFKEAIQDAMEANFIDAFDEIMKEWIAGELDDNISFLSFDKRGAFFSVLFGENAYGISHKKVRVEYIDKDVTIVSDGQAKEAAEEIEGIRLLLNELQEAIKLREQRLDKFNKQKADVA